jgi:NAD-dependent deacetylase
MDIPAYFRYPMPQRIGMNQNQHIGPLVSRLRRAKNVVALTGSGISAESGIPTFRGEEGLWKTYRAQDLATPQAFARDPKLVWEWYDWRRGLMGPKQPNAGHQVLAAWERTIPNFTLITQNIDGLHRRAGSRNVLELHGNIWKLRCTEEGTLIDNSETPLSPLPPLCPDCGAMLRPHVVWFGESLDPDVIQRAFSISARCDLMFVVGTSAVVHPAASLPLAALEAGATVVEINPEPTPLSDHAEFSFRGKAGAVLPRIDQVLKEGSAYIEGEDP